MTLRDYFLVSIRYILCVYFICIQGGGVQSMVEKKVKLEPKSVYQFHHSDLLDFWAKFIKKKISHIVI
jgi:hypothetical protein